MDDEIKTSGDEELHQVDTAVLPVMPDGWEDHMEDFYFPINVNQVKDILGKMLTHVEAMNLPSEASKANKDLVRQTIWAWFSDVQENSLTSYRGCIAPVELPRTPESPIK